MTCTNLAFSATMARPMSPGIWWTSSRTTGWITSEARRYCQRERRSRNRPFGNAACSIRTLPRNLKRKPNRNSRYEKPRDLRDTLTTDRQRSRKWCLGYMILCPEEFFLYMLGGDALGCELSSRIVPAAQSIMLIAAVAVAGSLGIGTCLELFTGYAGRRTGK